MTHLNLDQFQSLLDAGFSGAQRDTLVDHILSCDQCATQFKALKALEDAIPNPAKPKRHLLRYALGVAAVMAMAISPYLSQKLQPNANQLAQQWSDNLTQATQQASLGISGEILKVNFQSAVDHWSSQQDLLKLVDLQNQAQSN